MPSLGGNMLGSAEDVAPCSVQSGDNGFGVSVLWNDFHFQAVLRCAITGLALERYRQEMGHWPGPLDELAPAYLKVVPLSPFDGQPSGHTSGGRP